MAELFMSIFVGFMILLVRKSPSSSISSWCDCFWNLPGPGRDTPLLYDFNNGFLRFFMLSLVLGTYASDGLLIAKRLSFMQPGEPLYVNLFAD